MRLPVGLWIPKLVCANSNDFPGGKSTAIGRQGMSITGLESRIPCPVGKVFPFSSTTVGDPHKLGSTNPTLIGRSLTLRTVNVVLTSSPMLYGPGPQSKLQPSCNPLTVLPQA